MKTRLLFSLLFIFVMLSSNAQVNLTNGLIAYYPLDGNAKDSSANSLDGNVIGTTSDANRYGKANTALKFNGTSDAISVAHNALLNLTGDKTISVWYKITDSTRMPPFASLIYKRGRTDFPTFGIFFGEDAGYRGNRYKPAFIMGKSSPNDNKQVFAKERYRDFLNQWVNILATYSTADGYMRIYFNGALSDSLSATTTFVSNTSIDSLQIGRGNRVGTSNYSATYFNGSLDDIRIYNRVLNAAEVDAVLKENKPVGIFTPTKNTKQFTVYPNPSNGKFTIYSSFNFDKNIQVNVRDIQGRQVYSSEIKNGTLMNLAHLSNGTYIVEIVYDNVVEHHKTLIN